MQVRKFVVATVLSISAVMVGALPSMARPGTIDSPHFGVNLRSSPSAQSTVLDALPDRTPVEILRIINQPDRTGGVNWYYVRSTGRLKTEGWIRDGYLRFQSSNQIYGTLAVQQSYDVINIRSAPSTQGRVLHTGAFGDLVMVGRSARGEGGYRWYYITYPNQAAGWVREDLISIWPKGCIITCPVN